MAITNLSIPTPQVTTLGDAISGGLKQGTDLATALQNIRTAQSKIPLTKAQTALAQAQAAGIPSKSALNFATAQKTLQDINMVNKVGNPQMPPLMRAYNLYLYNKDNLGENNPRTVAALKTYNTMSDAITSSTKYKGAVTSYLPIKLQPPTIRETGYRGAMQQGGVLQTPPGVTMPGGQPQPQQPQQMPQQQPQQVPSAPQFAQPQSTKHHVPAIVRNAVLGTGDTPQNTPEIAEPDESTLNPDQPNRLVHPAPQSGDINAQQKAILGELSPAGVAQQTAAGKDTQAILTNASDTAKQANDELTNLRAFHSAYQNIKGYNRGPGGGLIKVPGSLPLDANAQAALKNGNQLVLKNISLFKGTGTRLNEMIFKSMKEGNLNILMSPESEKMIYDQMNAHAHGNIIKSRLLNTLFNAYPSLRKKPQVLNDIATRAAEDYDPVDEQGKVHPEMFDEWPNYASPAAVDAIMNGKDWLPEDVSGTGKSVKQFRDVARAKDIPVGILIKRYRALQQRQKAGGIK